MATTEVGHGNQYGSCIFLNFDVEYPKPLKKTALLWTSIFFGLLLILERSFQWALFETLTPFFASILTLVLILTILGVFTWSIIYLIKFHKKNKLAWCPFCINLMAIFIFSLFTFGDLYIKSYFSVHSKKLEAVVQMTKSGELPINRLTIALPKEYRNISKGGSIVVERTESGINILFFTVRGLVDNFSGYVYISGNESPTMKNFSCGKIVNMEKLKDHWFWISCT